MVPVDVSFPINPPYRQRASDPLDHAPPPHTSHRTGEVLPSRNNDSP